LLKKFLEFYEKSFKKLLKLFEKCCTIDWNVNFYLKNYELFKYTLLRREEKISH